MSFYFVDNEHVYFAGNVYNVNAAEKLGKQGQDILLGLKNAHEKNFDFNLSRSLQQRYAGVVMGLKMACKSMGYPVAYDWAGHRGEFFFPTVTDIEMEDDWRYQCDDHE